MALELDVQKRLTTAFIATAPVTLVLHPRVKTQTPTGGFAWSSGTPRPPQVMRLVEPPTVAQVAPKPQVAGDGVEREVLFLLLGEWDATIGQYDTFTYDGLDWEVVQVAHFNGWERRASVARHG